MKPHSNPPLRRAGLVLAAALVPGAVVRATDLAYAPSSANVTRCMKEIGGNF